MAQEISLLDFLLKLFGDEELRAEFAENPQQVLDEYQLSDLSAEDVHDALVLVQDNQTADFSRSYDTGGNQIHVPPPPPAPAPEPGQSEHEAAVQYLNN
ncbi:MAG TPA: IniB N-terminal domain-containing protein, partial [Pseudonocardia sp.]|nr:IniB N-terminal domain-containing protein [Pseudonocardia sp.]